MVTHARKVFYPSASNKNNAVFLQIVTDTRNICGNFDAVG